MKRVKYVYNPHTLQYEEHRMTQREKFKAGLYFMSAVLFTSVLVFVITYQYFPTPKERILQKENQQYELYLSTLSEDFQRMSDNLDQLHEKDGQVHRTVFGLNPIDEDVWKGGVGGHDKYGHLEKAVTSGKVLTATLEKVDQLQHKLSIQKKSMDTLVNMAMVREKRFSSMPSIKPVKEDELQKGVKFLSGFGMRIHPIHKVRKFHKGIDFTAPKGTDIRATGDGVVRSVNKVGHGFGRHLLIDHGYGYKTLYAHMHAITVKEGQRVKKGQKIGIVGSTGTSTAPHLHYEVWKNGQPVNPIDYVMDGLTPKEYLQLVKKASQSNQSFD